MKDANVLHSLLKHNSHSSNDEAQSLLSCLKCFFCHKNESFKSHWLPGKVGNCSPGATGRIWIHVWNPEQL